MARGLQGGGCGSGMNEPCPLSVPRTNAGQAPDSKKLEAFSPCLLLQVRDEGKTRPEVILRNLGTRPGEVRARLVARLGLWRDVWEGLIILP